MIASTNNRTVTLTWMLELATVLAVTSFALITEELVLHFSYLKYPVCLNPFFQLVIPEIVLPLSYLSSLSTHLLISLISMHTYIHTYIYRDYHFKLPASKCLNRTNNKNENRPKIINHWLKLKMQLTNQYDQLVLVEVWRTSRWVQLLVDLQVQVQGHHR